MDDWQNLEAYVKTGSEKAFGELVARYSGIVYSACLRQLHDPHLADDATQAVFLVLARKAKTLPKGVVLSGWLFKAARYAAVDVVRREARRWTVVTPIAVRSRRSGRRLRTQRLR